MTSHLGDDRSAWTRGVSRAIRILERKYVARSLPLLVLLFALCATCLLWIRAKHDSRAALQTEFDDRASETRSRIERRMQAYEQVLRGTQMLFAVSPKVTRAQFRTYVAGLRLRDKYPGIQGVGFSLIVPPGKKQAHVAALRTEGFPDYTLKPEGDRDLYTAIIYLEPFTGRNLRAFGFDMYSEPVRRVAMERARDSGGAAILEAPGGGAKSRQEHTGRISDVLTRVSFRRPTADCGRPAQ